MWMRSSRGAMEIEAELRAPHTHVRLVHYHFPAPPASTLRVEGKFRLELCLTPRHRSARGCFSDLWSAQRFERIGEIFLLPPSLSMRARSDEATSLTALVCELEADSLLARHHDWPPTPSERQLTASLDIRDPKIRQILLRLAEEVRHPGFATETLVESLATQLAIELIRLGASLSECREPGGLAPWQLRSIEERLREARETPTLAELAVLCRISVRQLTRGFRASRGYSVGSYVASRQLEHAKRLLATDQSITAIASILGFSTPSNFCFAFRRVTGVSPGQFRQTLLRH